MGSRSVYLNPDHEAWIDRNIGRGQFSGWVQKKVTEAMIKSQRAQKTKQVQTIRDILWTLFMTAGMFAVFGTLAVTFIFDGFVSPYTLSQITMLLFGIVLLGHATSNKKKIIGE